MGADHSHLEQKMKKFFSNRTLGVRSVYEKQGFLFASKTRFFVKVLILQRVMRRTPTVLLRTFFFCYFHAVKQISVSKI